MATKKDSYISRLQNYFDLGVDNNKVIPTKTNQKTKKKEFIFDQKENSRLKALYDYWLNNCHDDLETLKNRLERYQDMERVTINNVFMARTMKIYADETIQADENKEPLSVEAPSKQKKFIEEFFDNTSIFTKLWPTVYNIIKYGDAGWLLSVEEGLGVTEIQTISPYNLIDRIEFKANEIEKEISKKTSPLSVARKNIDRINQLVKAVEEKDEDYSSYFKPYLFGFVVNDNNDNIIVPPWRFVHFRNYVDMKTFDPYGMPLFIHAIAPYRQLSAAMGLQVVARGARFPIDKYSLKLPVAMDPTEKLERTVEFLQELDNSGITTNVSKESPGIGERIITIDELFDFDQIVPDIDLGDIDDLEMLRDDLIIATGLPRFLLDPNASGFGTSGAAFAEQYKPFYREIFRLETILMEHISQVIKIHMIASGEFTDDEIDFTLSMPFPESQKDRDYISSQSDLVRLVNDIISSIGENVIGERDAVLPPEVLQDIYLKILPYDDEWVKSLIDRTVKEKEQGEITPQESLYGLSGNKLEESRKMFQELKKSGTYNELLEDTIYEITSKSNRIEYMFGRKHRYSSRAKYTDFNASKLIEFKKSDVKKLEETLYNYKKN